MKPIAPLRFDIAALAIMLLGSAVSSRAAPGDVDPSYAPALDGGIEGVAVQPDGKFILTGQFRNVSGVSRQGVARFHADGTHDTSFVPANFFGCYASAVQADGKILISGEDLRFGTIFRTGVARLTATGAFDSAFNAGCDGAVIPMSIQQDGKILIGGNFTTVGGLPRGRIARLLESGNVDPTFVPAGANASVYALGIQTDGKILVGGSFPLWGGAGSGRLVRLNPDGSRDTGFDPVLNGEVTGLAIQGDGKIVIGGRFTRINNVNRASVARLNADGTLDTTFNPGADNLIITIAPQCDGKIVLGGWFTSMGGQPRTYLARLTGGGAVDGTFLPDPSQSVYAAPLQADGKVLASGYFQRIGGVVHPRSARLENDPALSTLAVPDYRTIRWTRGGSAPETTLVSFDLSTNGGAGWTPLGPAERVGGAWQMAGLNLPLTGMIRARARVSAGYSSGLIESVATYEVTPDIAVQDGGETGAPALADGQAAAVDFGRVRQGSPVTRSFRISNTGGAPLSISGLSLPAGYSPVNPPAFPVTLDLASSLTLQVRLDAATKGSFAGSFEIAGNDPDESPFDFPVTAQVVGPEITVRQGTTELAGGQVSPVDFGSNVQGTPGVRPFTIANDGDDPLTVTGITLPDGFSFATPPAFPWIVGPERTFEVALSSTAVGIHAGVLEIASDDFDESVFRVGLTGEVFIPDPDSSIANPETMLRRQTGLREQTVRVANPTTATVPAFRLIIRGLPPGVEVFNASEIMPDGSVVVEVLQPLAPFSTFDLVIEYHSANRQPVVIEPRLSTEVILAPPQRPSPGGDTLAVLGSLRQSDGSFLVEFASIPGRRYGIEYSKDNAAWTRSAVPIRAAGTRTQWIDRGPPRTDVSPALAARRFYRIRELTE